MQNKEVPEICVKERGGFHGSEHSQKYSGILGASHVYSVIAIVQMCWDSRSLSGTGFAIGERYPGV